MIKDFITGLKAWLVGFGVAVAVLFGAYLKGRSAGKATALSKIEKENADAVREADAARDRTRVQLDAGRLRDEWTRD